MLTAIVAALLAVVPGALLGWCVEPGRGRWLVWTASPILSLGLTALGMAWLPALGLPNGVMWVLAAEVVLAALAVAVSLVRARRARSISGWWDPRPGRPALAEFGIVSLAALTCAGFGVGLFGRFAQPPGWDAMYHGMLTRNMLNAGDTRVTAACITGSTQSHVACHFYPLAADVSWGQASWLTGGHIGTAMLAWEAVIGPVALALAVYALVRLLGGRPVVAGCAAALQAVVGPLWYSTATGRTTQEIGPGLAIAAAALVVGAARSRQPLRMGVLAGIAVAGVLLTHTYEVLFAGVLAAAALAVLAHRLRLRQVVRTVLAAVITTVVVVAPMGTALLHADSERIQNKPTMPGNYLGAFRFWVTDVKRYALLGYPSPNFSTIPVGHLATIGLWITLPCLIASPLCLVLRELRWARPWLLTWAVFTGLGWWSTASTSGVAAYIAGLWYGVPERLRSLMFPVLGVLVVAGAVALTLVARRAVTLVARGRPIRRPTFAPALVSVCVVIALCALAAAPSVRHPLQRYLSVRVPHGASYPRAYRWLAEHTAPGNVAAYDQNLEMLTWSYADDNVKYLFGEIPASGSSQGDYEQRWQAWNWLVDNPGAAPAGCQVGRFGIEYVVTGGPRVPNFKVDYSRFRLAHSPRVDLVHRDGTIMIYRVNATGTACATTPTG